MDSPFMRTPFVNRDYRAAARLVLKNVWGTAILVTFVYGILSGGGSFNVNINFPSYDEATPEQLQRLYELVSSPAYLAIASFAGMLSMVTFVIGGPLKVGYARFCLKLADGRPVEFKDLFSGFDVFGEAFLLQLRIGLRILGWMLLLIVPGIVAAYRYSQAFFLLAENPGMKSGECIERSKEMMQGHKWQLFVLELSFLGWALLCILTLFIGFLWLEPYTNIAKTFFYRDVSGTTAESSRLYAPASSPYGQGYCAPSAGQPYYPPQQPQEQQRQTPKQQSDDFWKNW